MRHRRILALLALPLALSACQRIGQRLGFVEPPMPILDGGPVCPSTAVLSDAVTVTKLRAGAPMNPDPQNVVLSAEMSQAQLECEYDGERNALTINLDFAVRATRGAAASGPDPELEYFIAMVDAQGTLLTKNIFKSRPDLNGRTAGQYTQSVDNFVFQLAMDARPADYQLLTGFQLTPAELAYNRIPRSLPQTQPRRP
jgi:hypothetical protein